MAVNLEIEDGSPYWYLSHDIWTVPGNDPEGSPGSPIAGNNCYLWARVHNTGSTPVNNATVRFYWANPAVGFDRNTANPIGTSFVSLDAGETAEVLCLTPWVPQYVNNGHECVLAEAFHTSADPLPATPAFNVPTDRHVAQLNLSVVMALKMMFHLAFEVHNPSRKEAYFTITAEQGDLRDIRGIKYIRLPEKTGATEKLGFVTRPCPDEDEINNADPIIERLKVPAGGRVGLTLVGRLKNSGAVVHVHQRVGNAIVGGLSALILSEEAGAASNNKKKKGA